jgi:tetratricopeptide (TPR) repeat protein
MNNLPDLSTLFDYDDPVESESRFVELAQLPELKADAAYHCELLTRLARTKGLQRRFEEAHQTIDQAKALDCEAPSCRVRIALEEGRIFNSSEDKESARPCFLKAYEIAVSSALDELAVDAAHMMGIVEAGEETLRWNERAIQIAEASADDKAKAWFGSLYNNTAWTYHDSGQLERALELFHKAKEYRIARNQPKQIQVAEWSIGRCLRSMGRVEEALEIQDRLHAEGDESGYGAEELGELHLLRGDQLRSQAFFAEAYEELSKDPWLQVNEAERLERIRELSGDLNASES